MNSFYAGKTVLITGAASGIGKYLALQLAKFESSLILIDIQEASLKEVAQDCINLNARVEYRVCDLLNKEQCQNVFGELAQEQVDVIIANAGLGGVNPGPQFSIEVDERIMGVNYFGMVRTIAPFLPKMVHRKSGAIVGVSSLASIRGLPCACSYSASKAAQNNFLESMRVDLAPHGIKVTTILPGFVKTPMVDHDEFDMPFMVPVERAALKILKAVSKGKRVYAFPFAMRLLSLVNRWLPPFLFDFLLPKLQGKKAPKSAKVF